MEDALVQVLHDTSEIDSELLDDKTEVLGVLAADKQGLCLLTQGEIDPKLSTLASGLSKIGAKFNEEELPTIVLESNSKRVIIKQEDEVTVAVMKKK